MNNPFEALEQRLSRVENLLIDLKNQPKQESAESSEKLLSVKEAAEFLRLQPPTIYAKVHRGELPFMKESKRVYFLKSDLLKFIKDNRKGTNSEKEQALEQLESEVPTYLKK